MANDDWGPLASALQTTTRQPGFVWPTGSTTPKDVDDQAPIPLIVGIALALFIGFVIIVCCICRRRSLSSSSSSSAQESNAAYQRAPAADGNPAGGGFSAGVGGNSYPMAPVNSKYPPLSQGQQSTAGQGMAGGGMSLGQQQQQQQHQLPPTSSSSSSTTHHHHHQQQQQAYPVLPPSAYTPPYPLGTSSPLPAYMPTSLSSHTSSSAASHQAPSGFCSASPPAPAPAPTGMMMLGSSSGATMSTGAGSMMVPEFGTSAGTEGRGVVSSAGVTSVPFSYAAAIQSQAGYGAYQGQGQGMGQGQGYGQGQGMVYPGFQASMMGQRGTVGGGGGGGGGAMLHGVAYPHQGHEGQGIGTHPPTMPHTAMDYVPGGGFVPRVGSPMPPGTIVTELDQL